MIALTVTDVLAQIAANRRQAEELAAILRSFCRSTVFAGPHLFVPGDRQESDEDGYYDYETCDKPVDHPDHLAAKRVRRIERRERLAALTDEYSKVAYGDHREDGLDDDARDRAAAVLAHQIAILVIDLGLHTESEPEA